MNNSIAGVRVRILLRINRIMGNIVDDSSLTIIRMIVPRISRDTYGRILAKERNLCAVRCLYRYLDRHLESEIDDDGRTRSEIQEVDTYHYDNGQEKCSVNSTTRLSAPSRTRTSHSCNRKNVLAKYYSFPPDFHFNDQRLALNHNDLELQNVVWRGTVIEPRLQYRRYGAVPQIRFLPQSVTKSRLVLTNGRCVARRTFFFHPFLSHRTLSAAALASKPAITKENGGLTPKRTRELDTS